MTPIERAARAHYADAWGGKPWHAWEDVDEVERQEHMRAVRAVLTAIREPSEAMLEAGAEYDSETGCSGNPRKIYPAMIDAAMKE